MTIYKLINEPKIKEHVEGEERQVNKGKGIEGGLERYICGKWRCTHYKFFDGIECEMDYSDKGQMIHSKTMDANKKVIDEFWYDSNLRDVKKEEFDKIWKVYIK